MAGIAPTQSAWQTALGAFLDAILPSDVKSYAGVVNRVPEPSARRFVVFNPIRFTRLRTNIDAAEDCRFTGSIADTVLTATFGDGDFGTIRLGAIVFGTGIVPATTITAQTSGPTGGAGIYTVDKSQTLAEGTLASGQKTLEQGAEAVVQIDFHANDNTASDLAQIVSTTLRDPYGVQLFAETGLGVAPLYADDPRFVPFLNENQQHEWRWVVEAHLQVNQTVAVPSQYADAIEVELVSVDATYPP